MLKRFDRGKILRVVETPQGGIRIDAALTRTGILEYQNPDGSIRREYRSPAEVFKADSMAGLSGAPVTHLHPKSMVTPATWKVSNVVGHVSGSPVQEDDKIVAKLTIQDEDVIEKIAAKELREVSCGYHCKEAAGGRTDAGEEYDLAQTDIRYNHVALVPRGRAGRDVALRLDAAGHQLQIPEGKEEKDMKIEIIDGTEYEVGTPAHDAAVKARTDREQARKDQDEETQAELARLRELEASFPARVEARMKAVSLAKAHEIETSVKITGEDGEEVEKILTNEEIRVAVLTKLKPDLDLTGKSPEYVEARVDAAIEALPETNMADTRKRVERRDAPKITVAPLGKDEQARKDMIDNLPTHGQSTGLEIVTRNG